jgi:hypothetical protein
MNLEVKKLIIKQSSTSHAKESSTAAMMTDKALQTISPRLLACPFRAISKWLLLLLRGSLSSIAIFT